MLKTLINKTLSVLLTLILLTSFLIPVTASASETTTTSDSGLIYDFGSVPLNVKSKLYSNDELQYNSYFIFRNSSGKYGFVLIKESDIDYFYVGSSSDWYLRFPERFNYTYCYFNFDGSYSSFVNTTYFTSGLYEFGSFYAYGYDSASDKLQNYVDNIVYSSVDIKCDGMTIYYAKNNKAVTVKNLLNLPAGTGGGEIVGPQPIPPQPGDYDFIGPLPLIPIEGDPTFQGFKDWLIKNKKYEDLVSYGINCTASNISSIVDLWTGNYNSISGFFSNLKSAWSTINAVTQAKNIYNWFERQWQLYKKSLITYETVPIKDNQVLNYDTDYDENGNFISSDVLYLKLILGTLISFKDSFSSYVDTLVSYISSLDVNLNRLLGIVLAAPQYTADAIYNNLVNPFNLILDAINNSSGSGGTTENVTNNYYTYNTDVSDTEQEAFDGLFTEYNQKYDELIRSKFPFISQVLGIFDEVWKACGYDTSSETSSLSVQSENMTVNQGPQQTQQDFVNGKLSTIFDGYDPSYLDSADISNAPSYTVTIAGTECSIIDFRIFEKYRIVIHAIITLVFWIPYVLNLLKAVPGLIAGVSDVCNLEIRSSIESPAEFEANILVEEEQRNANKVEDFKVFAKNNDGTFSAY